MTRYESLPGPAAVATPERAAAGTLRIPKAKLDEWGIVYKGRTSQQIADDLNAAVAKAVAGKPVTDDEAFEAAHAATLASIGLTASTPATADVDAAFEAAHAAVLAKHGIEPVRPGSLGR